MSIACTFPLAGLHHHDAVHHVNCDVQASKSAHIRTAKLLHALTCFCMLLLWQCVAPVCKPPNVLEGVREVSLSLADFLTP